MKLRYSTLVLAMLCSNALAQTKATHQEAREISTVLTAGGVTKAWSRGITGAGSIIGVIDQGFDVTHVDFAGSILAARNFNPTVAKIYGSTVTWGLHGTQMASIAAGNLNNMGTVGVAPDAMLLLAQVGQGGQTGSIDSGAVKLALDWLSANKAHIINMSFGSNYDATFQKGMVLLPTGVWKAPSNYGSMYGSTVTDMNGYALATTRGSILVAAAGNQGLPYAAFPGAFATQVDSTGKLILGGRMLIVGATDPYGTTMASFSNRAGHICTKLSGNVCNDPYQVKDFYVVAPGMQVYGAVPYQMNIGVNGAIAVNGTSPAAAYVSGGIALMKQAWPQLRPEQLVNITLNTAKDLGAKGVDDVYGHGMVDFDAATKPMGTIVLATASKLTGSGPAGPTTTLSSTGIKTTGAIGLGASSILQGAQVVDGMGRNYSVDLTRAVSFSNAMSYQYGTPWMSMAGGNYRHTTAMVANGATLTVMGSDQGVATQYDWSLNENARASFEFGVLSEQSGFLGTKGSGAMGFGNSHSNWMGFGIQHRLVGDTKLIGNYTVGITSASNVASSMIQLDSKLVADSWKIGLAQDNVFFKGKIRDTVSLSLAGPVAVRHGKATVTGVTGYTYSDNADGTTDATPIIQSERVSLAPQAREMNLVLGYNIISKEHTTIGVNLVRQFNASGQPGVQATGASIMIRSVF